MPTPSVPVPQSSSAGQCSDEHVMSELTGRSWHRVMEQRVRRKENATLIRHAASFLIHFWSMMRLINSCFQCVARHACDILNDLLRSNLDLDLFKHDHLTRAVSFSDIYQKFGCVWALYSPSNRPWSSKCENTAF